MDDDYVETINDRWAHELNHLDELSVRFMAENFGNIKPGSHYEAIREAFVVAYRLGKQNHYYDEHDFIHKQHKELQLERRRLDRYADKLEIKERKLHNFHTHLQRKLKEIKKLKSILKETFAIKQIE